MRSTGGYQPPGGSNPGLAGRLSWWAINVEATQIADSSDTASQFLPGGVAAFPTKVGMTDWGLGMTDWGLGMTDWGLGMTGGRIGNDKRRSLVFGRGTA